MRFSPLLSLLGFLYIAPALAFTHVQGQAGADGNGANASSFSTSFSVAVTSGNTVAGGVSYGTDTTTVLTGCTDDKANTYNIAFKTNSGGGQGQSLALFWLNNITNAPITVTCNVSPAINFVRVFIDEFSGVSTGASPTDGSSSHQTVTSVSGTDSDVSGNIITTVNGDLIYGVVADDGGEVTVNYAAGTGFTLDETNTVGQTLPIGSEHETQSTAGTIQATFTPAAANQAIIGAIAFKAQGGSASAQQKLPLLGVGQ